MAVTLTLGPSGDTINLTDGTNYAVRGVGEGGMNVRPARQRDVVAVQGRDSVRLNASQAGPIEISLALMVKGTSDDNLVTNWRAVVDKLRKARDFALAGLGTQVELIYKWNNATASVVYDVIDGDFPPAPGVAFPVPSEINTAHLTLVCLPYARSAAVVTPSSGTVTNDETGYTPTAAVGDAPIPCRMSLQNKQASTNMNFIRAAVRARGTPANFLFPIVPGANAPSGFSVTPQGTSSPVTGVTVKGRGRSATAGTASFDLGFRSGGTWYSVHAAAGITGTAWQNITGQPSSPNPTDPRTGVGWLISDINSYEWGIRKSGTTGVDITQLYVTVAWLDRDLTAQSTDLLVTANGAVNDWTATGVAEAAEWDAVNDPVATPDDVTTYITSATDLQVSVYATQDVATADKGYRLRSTASAEAVRITISSNISDQYGTFRVMVRAKGTAAEQLQLRWGGSTGGLITNTAVALAGGANVEIVDLGRMNIPEQEAPSDVSLASFVFSIWRGTGASTLDIDTIELWPADEYVEFEPTTGPAENEFAVIDSLARLPTAYLANSSGNRIQSLSHAGAAPRLQPSSNRILLRMSRSRTDDRRADSVAAALRYFPRWEWQRGSA
jgi:hypothetical protein